MKLLSFALSAAVVALSSSPALASMDLAKAKNCTACHAVDKKLVGPAYKEVAKKYAADKGAEAKLAKKIREGGTGVWGQISVDEELGMVYLPVEMPTGDYYGGHRPGNGLFGESIVALDGDSGQIKWFFQMTPNDPYDFDEIAENPLVDIEINGKIQDEKRVKDDEEQTREVLSESLTRLGLCTRQHLEFQFRVHDI